MAGGAAEPECPVEVVEPVGDGAGRHALSPLGVADPVAGGRPPVDMESTRATRKSVFSGTTLPLPFPF